MTISKRAVDTVHGQLMISKEGHTYAELAKLTGYSISTIKIAVSGLNHAGAIAVSYSKPIVIRAINTPLKTRASSNSQTLVVRELEAHPELDSEMVAAISGHLSTDKEFSDEMLNVIYGRIRTNTPEKNHNLMVFLVNLTEVLRLKLDDVNELSDDDLIEGTV